MTAEKKQGDPKPLDVGEMTLEIKKSRKKCNLIVTGVMAVSALSSTEILLASHAGRVEILGSGLLLSVFENGALEISGEICDVRLGYGKA